jgi:hypothetical protein
MIRTTLVAGLACAAALFSASSKPPTGNASNDSIEIGATLHNGKEAVQALLGSGLDGYIVVVDVTVTPKGGKALTISPDDFILRSDRDGQRSGPFAPSQVAGDSVMVVSSAPGGGGIAAENPGTIWGGTLGRPGRLGNGGSPGIGNTASNADAATQTTKAAKEDPLLATLKARVLKLKETKEPVSGLLYFLMEGKHKTKQLELLYKGPAGKLSLRFHE